MLYTLNVRRWLPVQDCSHLVLIQAIFTRTNDVSKVLDIKLSEFALLQLGPQLMLVESAEDFTQVRFMLFCTVTINE